MQFLKRKVVGNGTAKALATTTPSETDETFAKKYPALAEFLSAEEWDPETPRTRGTITLFWEEGGWKAAINDRDGGLVAFVAKRTFTDLLASVEKGLVGDSLDWRGGRPKGPGKRSRG